MDWLALIVACIKGLGAFATWANNRQLLRAGAMDMIAQEFKGQADDLAKADKARKAVRDAAARDPAGVLRDDDGFRRD